MSRSSSAFYAGEEGQQLLNAPRLGSRVFSPQRLHISSVFAQGLKCSAHRCWGYSPVYLPAALQELAFSLVPDSTKLLMGTKEARALHNWPSARGDRDIGKVKHQHVNSTRVLEHEPAGRMSILQAGLFCSPLPAANHTYCMLRP